MEMHSYNIIVVNDLFSHYWYIVDMSFIIAMEVGWIVMINNVFNYKPLQQNVNNGYAINSNTLSFYTFEINFLNVNEENIF
jgi:hypothetical protein